MFQYFKFSLAYVVGVGSAASMFAGGDWIYLGVLGVILFYVVGDAIFGDDTSTPDFKNSHLLTAQLWTALPLLFIIVFSFVWSASSKDPLGLSQWLTSFLGVDFNQVKQSTTIYHQVAGVLLTGLMIGLIGTITAHELVHRTWDPISLAIGRWLLGFSFDTSFSIEHVYGHHRNVATLKDPASAPRGRNVYWHIIVSTIFGNISAWNIEAQRLARRKQKVYSWSNKMITGQLISLFLVIFFYLVAGSHGAMLFVLSGIWGKCLLEIVNYMEHYGLVRAQNAPVEPKHSWNSNKKISSWTMFNLTRHSHHHQKAGLPFQELQPMENAPMMLSGYLSTILLAMIPPLWRKLMKPKLAHWDQHYANDKERALLKSWE